MNFIENIPIKIDLNRMMLALSPGNHKTQMKTDAVWAIDIITELAHPKALVGYFDIESLDSEKITIISQNKPDQKTLAIGKRGVGLMADARCAQISFVTLGNGLQDLEDDLRKQGEHLKWYILDVAAVLALEEVGQAVNQMAEKRAAQKGWGVGRRLSPGDLQAWSIEDQNVLASLLPIESIGIEVKPGGMLTPLKSASSVIGMGPTYSSRKVGTICEWCPNQRSCIISMSHRSEEVMIK